LRALQAFRAQTLELSSLREENARLTTALTAAKVALADAQVADKAELEAQLRQLKATIAEFGSEVARLHMEEQKSRGEVRELRAALQLAQEQAKSAMAFAAGRRLDREAANLNLVALNTANSSDD
jgi:phage shock protein A